jgi:hypothetical protein
MGVQFFDIIKEVAYRELKLLLHTLVILGDAILTQNSTPPRSMELGCERKSCNFNKTSSLKKGFFT